MRTSRLSQALGACLGAVLANPSMSARAATPGPEADATTRLPIVPVVASEAEDRPPARLGVEVVIDRQRLDAANTVTTADALRYAPNLTIRSRYIGDRNAIIGGRAAGTLQSARSLVYADGLLLSDFLDSGYANPPRWDLVGVGEIDRVEVLYGPYSARYPGNSLGTTVIVHTRMPRGLETSARAQAFVQDFSDAYGTDRDFNGHALSAGIGNGNGDGRWGWRLALDRIDNRSQPMQYVIARPGGDADAVVVVEGATADRNPDGSPRLVVGRSSLDHTRQNLAKFVLGYAPTDALSARLTVADWRNDSDTRAETLLHDRHGAPVYDGTIDVGGRPYRISDGAFSPRRSREEHRLFGLELGGRIGVGWRWDATASRYDFGTSRDREASGPPPLAATGGPGSIVDADGSGWQTADLRATGPLGSTHQLDMGLHADRYVLDTRVHDADDWRGARGALVRTFGGRSRTEAAYLQDEWNFATNWTATFGLRAERWRAYRGRRADAGTELAYPSRSRSALSPKAALAWTFADAWQVRASLGRAVRFPTVGELFQGSISAGAIVNGNPDLEPERDLAMDLSLEHAIERGRWRVSLFHHDLRDSLYTQTDVSVTPTVTNVQNIGRVRLAGIDAEFECRDVGIDGLDVYASIAFNHSRTLEDRQFPAAEGRDFPRMPRTRASVQVDWRFADGWDASLGGRHSGRQYGTLDNRDFVDTFGAVSSYTVFDAKLRFQPAPGWSASLGVDNLTDERYWVYHPWPGRTWYAELRWDGA